MAVKRIPRQVEAVEFDVKGANDGDYGVLIVPPGKQGVTITNEGVAGSAALVIGFKSGSGIKNYSDSRATIAVGDQGAVYAGEKQEVYVIISGSTASTDLKVTGNVW